MFKISLLLENFETLSLILEFDRILGCTVPKNRVVIGARKPVHLETLSFVKRMLFPVMRPSQLQHQIPSFLSVMKAGFTFTQLKIATTLITFSRRLGMRLSLTVLERALI